MRPIYFFKAMGAMGNSRPSHQRKFGLSEGLTLAALALLITACSRGPTQSALEVEQPEGWADQLAMDRAEDLNPHPDIIEIELEARVADLEIIPGKTTPVWTYNGVLPGPHIRAKVGDQIIVRFKNSLPEATSLQWTVRKT